MLIMLYPDQVAAQWEDLYPSIEAALPPIVGDTIDRKGNLLKAILSGNAILWVIVDTNTIYGLMLTTFHTDVPSGARNLLIYALYANMKIPDSVIESTYEVLKRFAKAELCSHIIAYTNNDRVLRMVEKIRGDSSTRLIVLEV